MGRAVGKMAGSRRGRLLRARHLRNLTLALCLSAMSIIGAGLRANHLLDDSRDLTQIIALIPMTTGRMEQVMSWLEAEDAMPNAPAALLAPLVARATAAAHDMEALHEQAVRLTWQSGHASDDAIPVVENSDRPVIRIDIMLRSFLRGIARIAEATGSQRAAARRDMRALAQDGLMPAFAEVHALATAEHASRHASLRVVLVLGAIGAGLGMLLAIVFHVRGPGHDNEALESRVDEAMTRVEEVEVYLRGAERDRARMMDLSAAGLELPAERMRAAAGLLARTPLTETQGRVLHGLRHALGEIAGRVEGLRVLASQGDGRLRLTLRTMRPGAIYAEWLQAAQVRAQAEGKQIIAELEMDQITEVRGDELMVRRALDRLLDDALRRSAKGGRVGIVAQLEATSQRWPELRVVVEHDGPAPGPSEIAAIRAPFSSRPPSEATVNRSVDPFALAVVAAICTATGGGLDISARTKGGARSIARLRLAPVSDFFDEQLLTVDPSMDIPQDTAQGQGAAQGNHTEDPEGWADPDEDFDTLRTLGHSGAPRINGGRNRRRGRQLVPPLDTDPG